MRGIFSTYITRKCTGSIFAMLQYLDNKNAHRCNLCIINIIIHQLPFEIYIMFIMHFIRISVYHIIQKHVCINMYYIGSRYRLYKLYTGYSIHNTGYSSSCVYSCIFIIVIKGKPPFYLPPFPSPLPFTTSSFLPLLPPFTTFPTFPSCSFSYNYNVLAI